MKSNKVLVKLYIPDIEAEYDVWIPKDKKVYNIITLFVKAIKEFTNGEYIPTTLPELYDKATAIQYDENLTVRENNIQNGSEIILI